MLIKREITNELLDMANQYPIVTITGPRQSGKTTLAKATFPQKAYFSLENPDDRAKIISDPRGFFNQNPDGAIIDEFQRYPELLSYLQGIVDNQNQKGQFILTGSNQLSLLSNITQSLAGRTALLKLLPLSLYEIQEFDLEITIDQILYNGFYPGIYSEGLNAYKAYRNYYETYIERDVRQLINIQNLNQFQNFIRLCAGRIGQLFNASNLSNEVGVSVPTIQNWMSILQATYIVFLLNPWYSNINKRLIKSPKIYFYDVGLANYLLRNETVQHVATHPLRGSLFENMVLLELLKSRYNKGLDNNFYYYRDQHNNEVDIVQEQGQWANLFEIKSSMTFHPDFLKGLNYLKKLIPDRIQNSTLVYSGNEDFPIQNHKVVNYQRLVFE
jgi:uncharacterized protein